LSQSEVNSVYNILILQFVPVLFGVQNSAVEISQISKMHPGT